MQQSSSSLSRCAQPVAAHPCVPYEPSKEALPSREEKKRYERLPTRLLTCSGSGRGSGCDRLPS